MGHPERFSPQAHALLELEASVGGIFQQTAPCGGREPAALPAFRQSVGQKKRAGTSYLMCIQHLPGFLTLGLDHTDAHGPAYSEFGMPETSSRLPA